MKTIIKVTTRDSENWITINGAKVLVEGDEGKGYTIKGGAGGKLTGKAVTPSSKSADVLAAYTAKKDRANNLSKTAHTQSEHLAASEAHGKAREAAQKRAYSANAPENSDLSHHYEQQKKHANRAAHIDREVNKALYSMEYDNPQHQKKVHELVHGVGTYAGQSPSYAGYKPGIAEEKSQAFKAKYEAMIAPKAKAVA